MLEMPTRRGLITGLVAFIAAPAIVRASSLMPVSSRHLEPLPSLIAGDWVMAFRYIAERDHEGLLNFVVERIPASKMLARP